MSCATIFYNLLTMNLNDLLMNLVSGSIVLYWSYLIFTTTVIYLTYRVLRAILPWSETNVYIVNPEWMTSENITIDELNEKLKNCSNNEKN